MRDTLTRILVWLAATGMISLAYVHAPLFSGPYNSYLLRPMASISSGALAYDWLGQTADPYVAFSALTAVALRVSPVLIYVLHGLLLGALLILLTSVSASVHSLPRQGRVGLVLLIAIALPITAGFSKLFYLIFNRNWGWCFMSGVAAQSLLGVAFEPSQFGVLLVASLAAFAHRRDRIAVFLAAMAALFHASYMLPAAFLSVGYSVHRAWRDQDRRGAAALLLLGGALIGLVAATVAIRFWPVTGERAAQAAKILVEERIPHHAVISRWLRPTVWIQLGVIGVGLFLARKNRLVVPLLACLFVSLGMTLVQAATHSHRLALLFPWRVSVLLVPTCTSLLAGWLVVLLGRRASAPSTVAIAVIVAVAAMVYGADASRRRFAAYDQEKGVAMMRWVRERVSVGQLYVVPLAMKRFRLEARAPIFVDWKTHPFRSEEVLEWYRRVQRVRALEKAPPNRRCPLIDDLIRREGVTHFVLPRQKSVDCQRLTVTYQDADYSVWAARPF